MKASCFGFYQYSTSFFCQLFVIISRRLGYSVDVEDRRGKDEQRVDEGLHLHIYKV